MEKNLRTLFKKAQAKQVRLLAPDFIFLEIVNALRYSLKEESLAQQTLRHILEFPLKLAHLSSADYKLILNLAWNNKTTSYDSAYHYLAIARNGDFLTFDKAYYTLTKRLNHIELLE